MSNYMSQESKGRYCQNHLSENEIRHTCRLQRIAGLSEIRFHLMRVKSLLSKKRRRGEEEEGVRAGKERLMILSGSVSQVFLSLVLDPRAPGSH